MANDQAEHLTILAILVQNGLECRRITRLVIFGIEFASFLPVIGFDLSLLRSRNPLISCVSAVCSRSASLCRPDGRIQLFKPAGLTVFISLSLLSFYLLFWNFRVSFCTYEGAVPYRSSAQMSCRLMTKATSSKGDYIYIRFSTLRSHFISIISISLRAKHNASTSN
jgi:hypothetical protein